MHPIVILLIGVAIVIGGVLMFRLHAFLALVLAALVVGSLTPQSAVEQHLIEKEAISNVAFDRVQLAFDAAHEPRPRDRYQLVRMLDGESPETVGEVEIRYVIAERSEGGAVYAYAKPISGDERQWQWPLEVHSPPESPGGQSVRVGEFYRSGVIVAPVGAKQGIRSGMRFLVLRDEGSPQLKEIAELVVEQVSKLQQFNDGPDELSRFNLASAGDRVTLTAGDIVIHPLARKSAASAAKQTVGERVAKAFGNTCANIGILIALAAIIGKCLLDSGAADRIVRSALKVVGERGAPVAFVGSGFLLGIPVFFDTVFYLMIPLGKALRLRTGRNYLLYVLTIVAGASMAHSLVPPTPGPLLVAEELGIDLGLMILAGCCVGVFSATAGLLFAMFVNRRAEVPLRESPDFSLKDIEELSQREESELPPLWLSLMPIILPVILIAGYTVVESFELLPKGSALLPIAETLGNKNIALAIATAIAMGTLVWKKRTSLKELAASIQSALASGGVIILITAGGGAFGGVLQQTGVAGLIRDLPQYSPLVIIVLAFLITTAIRTAQGSATVAMITAVGILAGFAEGGSLGCHPVYLALAIGCGSKPIAWMNDSGFWVICKMSGMTEGEGLKFVTPMSVIMGIVGLIVTMIGVVLLPFPFG